ncbi:MAG: hypothetical protein ACK5N0_13555 [Synechococcaceae cyanobacterium]
MSQTPNSPTPGGTAEQALAAQTLAAPAQAAGHPHNFDVQKDVHRQIRNDPDYDDWEYGTEPLPHEAWTAAQAAAAQASGGAAVPDTATRNPAAAADAG